MHAQFQNGPQPEAASVFRADICQLVIALFDEQ